MGVDVPISDLQAAGTVSGTEDIVLVQSGVTKRSTAQDVANLGGGGNSGLVLLASGTIINQEFAAFAFPAGYSLFQMDITDMFSENSGDSLAIIFSTDGGSTYHLAANDYENVLWYFQGIIEAPGGGGDNVGVITNSGIPGPTDPKANATLRIYPFDEYPYICAEDITKKPTNMIGARVFYSLSTAALFAEAGNATNMVLMPYGNEDYPPTSGNTFSFSYQLRGVAA